MIAELGPQGLGNGELVLGENSPLGVGRRRADLRDQDGRPARAVRVFVDPAGLSRPQVGAHVGVPILGRDRSSRRAPGRRLELGELGRLELAPGPRILGSLFGRTLGPGRPDLAGAYPVVEPAGERGGLVGVLEPSRASVSVPCLELGRHLMRAQAGAGRKGRDFRIF